MLGKKGAEQIVWFLIAFLLVLLVLVVVVLLTQKEQSLITGSLDDLKARIPGWLNA